MKTIVCRATVAGLLVLLGSGAGAWALPGDDKDKGDKDRKVVEKRRIVLVDSDGKERVIEGAGPMVRRGFLGVGLTELTPELRTHFGVPEDAGVMVSQVEKGSPADKAGLEVGDVVTRIDGKDVKSSWDVRARIRDLDEGQQVPLEVWRNRKAQTLSATVALRERPEFDMGPLFLRGGGGEDGPAVLRFNGELGGLPEHIELPPPGSLPPGHEVRIERRSPRERQLEQRLQVLEKRIAELEKQLAKKGN